MTPADWTHHVKVHWSKQPVQLSDRAPFDGRTALNIARIASEPFRAGTRFQSLPDVRFFVADACLRAPGALLPGSADQDLDAYIERVKGDASSDSFLLIVEQPIALHFDWWAAVRDRVQALWRQLGCPILPIVTQICIGDAVPFTQPPARPIQCAELLWVLWGQLHVRLSNWQAQATCELHGRTDDLLYWPARYICKDSLLVRGALLRLRIPLDSRMPSAIVRDLLIDELQSLREGDHAVPYYSARMPRNGCTRPIAPLAATSRQLGDLWGKGIVARRLQIEWAKHVSASALQPVPAPRTEIEVVSDSWWRMPQRDAVVRTHQRRGACVWAVNGHAFTVGGVNGHRLLDNLREGEPQPLSALCRPNDSGALALLQRLHCLHAVEPAAP